MDVSNYCLVKWLYLGGPTLLCQRNSRNQTAREMALSLNLPAHVDVIDDTVTDWLTSNKHGAEECRSLLALYSYDFGSLFDAQADVSGVATYKEEFYRLQVSGFHQTKTSLSYTSHSYNHQHVSCNQIQIFVTSQSNPELNIIANNNPVIFKNKKLPVVFLGFFPHNFSSW